jgi:ABC-2 type transport system ATP-binding protein
MPAIELQNVEVFYEDFQALKGISCVIDGGAVGLLGPNGAGKSTLMKTLLGFNRATKGSVRVFGMEMPKHALQVRTRLGYMPEREVVSPKVSAVSFLTYCGQLFGMERVDAMERTHEVLNYVGIGDSRYRKMDTYSTGMLQRVKLAQALVHDPELLLLDEPTNGLDPDGRIELLDLVKEVAKSRGVTVVLSSHLLPDVQHVCERIIMIGAGRIAREGTLDELTAQRGESYEVRVRDNADGFIGALARGGCTWKRQQDGTLIVTTPNGNGRRTLFEMARDQGTHLRHFRAARTSLEQVFLEAVAQAKAEDAAAREA